MSTRTYVVQRGDSLASIARRFYGDTALASAIAQANREQRPNATKPRVGMELVIPRHPREPFDPRTRRYLVQPSDTLSTIALRFYRNTQLWKLVYDANRDLLSDPGKLRHGQDLFIPVDPSRADVEPEPVTLRLGSRGAPVATLQRDLRKIVSTLVELGDEDDGDEEAEKRFDATCELYCQRLAVTGVFGPATDRAVRRIQHLHNVRADGIVRPHTRKLISDLATGDTIDPHDHLIVSPPDRPSNAMAAVQRDLLALGFSLTPGGFFDEATRDALHQFQARHGLARRDASDQPTRTALFEQTMVLDDDAGFDPEQFQADAFFPGEADDEDDPIVEDRSASEGSGYDDDD